MDPFRQPVLVGGGPPPSGFPQILASAIYNTGSSLTATHPTDMPSGIVSGDRLLMIVRIGGAASTATAPSGWTTKNAQNAHGIFTKISDGTEGASQTWTSAASRRALAVCYRISPGTDVDIAENTITSDVNASLTPAGGTKKYLWFVTGSMSDNDFTREFTNHPADFTLQHYLETTPGASVGGAGDCQLYIATRELEMDTLTPGDWAATAWGVPRKSTIAIHP